MFCPVCGEQEDPIHVKSSEWQCPNCDAISTPFEWLSMTGDDDEQDEPTMEEMYPLELDSDPPVDEIPF